MSEALIDELWTRSHKLCEPHNDIPEDSVCLHDFLNYKNGETWCNSCGAYQNMKTVHPKKRPSTVIENMPCDPSSKEKYFLTVLENVMGEEAVSSIQLSTLKTISDQHKKQIASTCVTRKEVQIYIKIHCGTSDRKVVNSHLGLFIRCCGAKDTHLSIKERSKFITDYDFILYNGQKIRPKVHLLSIMTKPLSWV